MSDQQAQAISGVRRGSLGPWPFADRDRLGVGIAAERFIFSKIDVSARSEPSPSREEPVLKRVGDRIVVPEGSPLRSRLAVAPVEMTEVSHKLVLPAVVEADPARTVKVLPPVTGRVTDLKVQLGARVTKGQDLAVIDSGDLAQAYSDDREGAGAVKLTKQALDRLMLLEKTSAHRSQGPRTGAERLRPGPVRIPALRDCGCARSACPFEQKERLPAPDPQGSGLGQHHRP